MHGGRSPQVRHNARVEIVRQVFEQGMAVVWAKHHRQMLEWQTVRIATVSRLLGIPAEQVGWAEIVWCHVQHGVPPLEDEAPKIGDIPMDGRLRRVWTRGDV